MRGVGEPFGPLYLVYSRRQTRRDAHSRAGSYRGQVPARSLFALDGCGGKASAAGAAAAVRERVKLDVQLGLRTEGPAQIRHLECRIGLSGNVMTLAVSGSSVTII
jgi:hypothetical protein